MNEALAEQYVTRLARKLVALGLIDISLINIYKEEFLEFLVEIQNKFNDRVLLSTLNKFEKQYKPFNITDAKNCINSAIFELLPAKVLTNKEYSEKGRILEFNSLAHFEKMKKAKEWLKVRGRLAPQFIKDFANSCNISDKRILNKDRKIGNKIVDKNILLLTKQKQKE